MHPFDTSPVKQTRPPRRSVGRVLLLIALGTIGVACCLPGGGYAAWYLTLDTGPHTTLPSACSAMTGETFRALVGDTEGRHKSEPTPAGSPGEFCFWSGEATPSHTGLVLAATLHERSPSASSVDEARSFYRSLQESLTSRAGNAGGTDRQLHGVGQGAWCMGEAESPSGARYECVVRDGNVVIRLTVEPPSFGDGPPGVPRLTRQGIPEALDRFMAGAAPPLLRDYIEDL